MINGFMEQNGSWRGQQPSNFAAMLMINQTLPIRHGKPLDQGPAYHFRSRGQIRLGTPPIIDRLDEVSRESKINRLTINGRTAALFFHDTESFLDFMFYGVI